jgi:hypothetical protein
LPFTCDAPSSTSTEHPESTPASGSKIDIAQRFPLSERRGSRLAIKTLKPPDTSLRPLGTPMTSGGVPIYL